MGFENTENTENLDTNGISQEDSLKADSSLSLADEGQFGSLNEGGKQPTETQIKQDYNPEWWKADERAKRGLFKDERDVIKSYWHLEKEFNSKYKPAFTEYEKLNKTFQDLGINPNGLADNWKEYQTLKDPNSENNQFVSKVNYFLQNPEDALSLRNVFEDLNRKDLQRKFPGYTEEQIQQQLAIQERISQLETQQKQREEELKKQELERLKVEIQKEVEQNIDQIMEFAKDKGIQITDEMAKNYFKTMEEAKIPPKYMKGLFMQLYQKEIFDNLNKKTTDNTIKNLNRQNSKVIPISKTSNNVKTPIKSDSTETRFKQFASLFGKKT
jgi:hypothetical protein